MQKTREQRIEWVRMRLDSYWRLERIDADEIGWIAFLMSCTRRTAARWVKAANGAEERVSPAEIEAWVDALRSNRPAVH
jgi:hypothetical protein